MNQPNYPSNLQDIFDKGNYSVLPEVMRQQATAQQQAEANVAGTQQAQDIAAQKLPYELEQLAATPAHTRAQTELMGSQSAEIKDKLAALPPAAQRMALAQSDMYTKMSDNDYKKLSTQYQKLGMFATAAESNGGQVPLAMQQDPEFQKFAPYMQNPNWIKNAKAAMMAHIALDPSYRQHIDAAGIQASSHLQGIREQVAAQERMNKANIDAGRWAGHSLGFQMMSLLKSNPIQFWVMQKNNAAEVMSKTAPDSPEYKQAQEAMNQAIQEEANARAQADSAARAAAAVNAQGKPAIGSLANGQGLQPIPTPQPVAPVVPGRAASKPEGTNGESMQHVQWGKALGTDKNGKPMWVQNGKWVYRDGTEAK